MLIRNEQMEAFQRSADRDYELRLVHFLQKQFLGATRESKAALVEGIREQVAHARSYGFLTECQIASYITSAWLLGDGFDRRFLAAREMLTSASSGDEKANWLGKFTKDLFNTLEEHR